MNFFGPKGCTVKKIQWEDRFNTRIPEIDQQHQKLFDFFNQLLEAASAQSCSSPQILGILKEMVRYTDYHFTTEQNLMNEFNYPELLDHSKEHKLFMDKTLAFLSDFEQGHPELCRNMIAFLREWMVNHILNTDQRLGTFLFKII